MNLVTSLSTLLCPWFGFNRSISLMCSSLIPQQCPGCLVSFIFSVRCEASDHPSSFFVGSCFQNLYVTYLWTLSRHLIRKYRKLTQTRLGLLISAFYYKGCDGNNFHPLNYYLCDGSETRQVVIRAVSKCLIILFRCDQLRSSAVEMFFVFFWWIYNCYIEIIFAYFMSQQNDTVQIENRHCEGLKISEQ